MATEAGIFSFPFRVYAAGPLPEFKVRLNSSSGARVYEPLAARPAGAPLSPDVPFSSWPEFRWAPSVPPRRRISPITGAAASPGSKVFYDAFRVDFRGTNPEVRLRSFVESFVAWLRQLSKQPWIGEYEPQTDPMLKYGFPCDSEGRATKAAFTHMKVTTFAVWMRLVDSVMWRQAGEFAAAGKKPPVYWSLFLDAQMQRAVGNIGFGLLLLALAIEAARDQNFPRFAAAVSKPVIGQILGPPFDDTDLLAHLSTRLESVHPGKRNLRTEMPAEWEGITNIYVARHHVAHGRPPVVKAGSGVVPASDSSLVELSGVAYRVLEWLETL